jgi:hypothetical protein
VARKRRGFGLYFYAVIEKKKDTPGRAFGILKSGWQPFRKQGLVNHSTRIPAPAFGPSVAGRDCAALSRKGKRSLEPGFGGIR